MTLRLAAIGLCFVLVSWRAAAGAEEPKTLDAAAVVPLVETFYQQTQTPHGEF